MLFRVMTFNIQHGRNHNLKGDVIDLKLMADTAAAHSPAVVGFNEVRQGICGVNDPFFPNEPAFFASELDGNAYFGKAISVSKNCLYGNCLFTKYPILKAETFLIPNPNDGARHETRCIIKALLEIEGEKITVFTSHFGLSHDEQQNCVDTLLPLIGECDTPLIFMGDLNMTDDDPLIKKLASVLTDCAAYKNNVELTFPSNDPKIRIDYIFVKGLKPINVYANKIVASDHFAMVADLELVK